MSSSMRKLLLLAALTAATSAALALDRDATRAEQLLLLAEERHLMVNGELVRANALLMDAPRILAPGTKVVQSGGLFGSSTTYTITGDKPLGSGNYGNVYSTSQAGIVIKQTIEKYPDTYKGGPHPKAGQNPCENEDEIVELFAAATPTEMRHLAMTQKSFVAEVRVAATKLKFRFQVGAWAGDESLAAWDDAHGGAVGAAAEAGFDGPGWLADCKRVALDASDGLARLKARDVFIADVKPDNIMLTIDKASGRVQKAMLIDFGLAKHMPKSYSSWSSKGFVSAADFHDFEPFYPLKLAEKITKRCPHGLRGFGNGTPATRAPEVAGSKRQGDRGFVCAPVTSNDVWSLGVSKYVWFNPQDPNFNVKEALAEWEGSSTVASTTLKRNPHLQDCGIFKNADTKERAAEMIRLLDHMLRWKPTDRIKPEAVPNFLSGGLSSYIPNQSPGAGTCDRNFAAAALAAGVDPGRGGKRQCELCVQCDGRKPGHHCKYCDGAPDLSTHCFSGTGARFSLSSRCSGGTWVTSAEGCAAVAAGTG
eukprot:g2997.t1